MDWFNTIEEGRPHPAGPARHAALAPRCARQGRGAPREGQTRQMTIDAPNTGDSPKPAPRPGPPRPCAPAAPAYPARRDPAVQRSAPVRPHRRRRNGVPDHRRRRTGDRFPAGRRQRGRHAHFGRRFDDLATEVTLMETRLASGTGDARKIKAAAAAAGRDAAHRPCPRRRRRAGRSAGRDPRPRRGDRRRRPGAPGGAPRRADRPQGGPWPPRPRGDLRELHPVEGRGRPDARHPDEWRTITGLDRKTDDALWKRYSAARETFNRRRGSHFAELDRERAGAKAAKERLCERAEELSGSTDWAPPRRRSATC